MLQTNLPLTNYLKDIDDPRRPYLIKHEFIDIITIAICAVISGAEGWNDIEEYGKIREDWFQTFLSLPNGIPSHDTFRKVFATIDPEQFRIHFVHWIHDIAQLTKGEIIAIDGKTARRSYDKTINPLHMVSAWAAENNLVLGQVKTEEKSNEITAIPKLLDMLDINGCIVTIDAMGCQKDIAKKIIDKKADYVLALKGNQGKIHKEVKEIFEQTKKNNGCTIHEETTTGHGRVEEKTCASILLQNQTGVLQESKHWKGLKSIIRIESKRKNKKKTTKEVRYYLSSLKTNAKKFSQIVRKHWSIENSLHWVLDVAFREDESRIRKGNSAENFAIMRHIALSLLKQEKSLKRGIKGKRLKAGWDSDYLLKILGI